MDGTVAGKAFKLHTDSHSMPEATRGCLVLREAAALTAVTPSHPYSRCADAGVATGDGHIKISQNTRLNPKRFILNHKLSESRSSHSLVKGAALRKLVIQNRPVAP